MTQAPNIDGILITWGDRLVYPGNRAVRTRPQHRLSGDAARQRAAAIRKRIEATVVRRAPQVMVKVTGGCRGMMAIAAHFRYISKNGRLEIEGQRGETMRGEDGLRDLADEWRFGGSRIPDDAKPAQARAQSGGQPGNTTGQPDMAGSGHEFLGGKLGWHIGPPRRQRQSGHCRISRHALVLLGNTWRFCGDHISHQQGAGHDSEGTAPAIGHPAGQSH
jgi:hypothetical protein